MLFGGSVVKRHHIILAEPGWGMNVKIKMCLKPGASPGAHEKWVSFCLAVLAQWHNIYDYIIYTYIIYSYNIIQYDTTLFYILNIICVHTHIYIHTYICVHLQIHTHEHTRWSIPACPIPQRCPFELGAAGILALLALKAHRPGAQLGRSRTVEEFTIW